LKEAIMPQTFTLGSRNSAVPILPLHRAPAGSSLWQRLGGLFRRGNARLQTIRQLNALSDEMLRDIGVDRYDIEGSVDNLIVNSGKQIGGPPR
jgi:uncharacterized protein YjiS (DUF1127 family)